MNINEETYLKLCSMQMNYEDYGDKEKLRVNNSAMTKLHKIFLEFQKDIPFAESFLHPLLYNESEKLGFQQLQIV